MAAYLTFNEITQHKSGIICDLLSASYAQILNQNLQDQFRQFDRDVFENPDTVGACTFITTLDSELTGMASFDPRQAPELGIIGHNCILPGHQRNGYGKQQILEIIRRLKIRDIKRATVTTLENPFFIPAHRMYLSCGFTELKTERKNPNDTYKTIYYEMKL